jgi:MFS family permease
MSDGARPEAPSPAPGIGAADRTLAARLRLATGKIRLAYLPVLVTYFCYGASAITAVALVFFEKEALRLTPAESASVAFWVGLPWSMKMVVGVASDRYPILHFRRASYLALGALGSLAGYVALATLTADKSTYLLASVLIAAGFMVQDCVADALSVEVARNEAELADLQALGRMALLTGAISVGYFGGWLADVVGARVTFAAAGLLPLLVVATLPFARERRLPPGEDAGNPLGGGNARIVLFGGLAYAAFSTVLQAMGIPLTEEIVLVVSGALIGVLLYRMGVSRAVVTAALVIFLFRATPSAGQGYSFWAIDRLGFDQRFLGLLAQVSSIVSLLGLIAFRRAIVRKPVSVTLFWVVLAATVLYLPTIGLFYGLHEWLGVSARAVAFVDTTISAPLAQLTMVPMLVLIARAAPPGAEATMFAIMASLMNLALSASQLFTRYLNTAFGVSQEDYANLGRLMIAVAAIGLLPLLALPLLRRQERLLPGIAPRPGEDDGST